jgi:hypothetical protein
VVTEDNECGHRICFEAGHFIAHGIISIAPHGNGDEGSMSVISRKHVMNVMSNMLWVPLINIA